MGNNINPQTNEKDYLKAIHSGTTTVGIIVNGGVVIGTESQATAGYTVATKQAQKLFEVNKYAAATISGGVADCQYVVNQISALSRLKEVEEGEVPEGDHLVVLFPGHGLDDRLRGGGVGEELPAEFGVAAGRFGEARPPRVFAYPLQEEPYALFYFFSVHKAVSGKK